MIRNIFRLRTAKRTICHGMKVRMKRVNAVGFVAKNDSRSRYVCSTVPVSLMVTPESGSIPGGAALCR